MQCLILVAPIRSLSVLKATMLMTRRVATKNPRACRSGTSSFVVIPKGGAGGHPRPDHPPKRERTTTMRVMVIVKATKNSEASVVPSEKLLTEMGKFNEELVKA